MPELSAIYLVRIIVGLGSQGMGTLVAVFFNRSCLKFGWFAWDFYGFIWILDKQGCNDCFTCVLSQTTCKGCLSGV